MRGKTIATVAAAIAMTVLLTDSARAIEPICGDVNRSGTITASDALSVLKASVGQSIALLCGPPGQPLKTGQTACYDPLTQAVINCAGSGQDGLTQAGIAPQFTDNGDGTITDSTTGLTWEKLSNDGAIHDVDATYNWTNAIATKIAKLNGALFAGHNDWRLPNVTELEALRNFGTFGPSTYPQFNTACPVSCTVTTCSCTKGGNYWTSTSSSYGQTQAWFIDFFVGNTFEDNKISLFYVRAVRGGL